jgi:hypothetical protein
MDKVQKVDRNNTTPSSKTDELSHQFECYGWKNVSEEFVLCHQLFDI